MSETLSPWNSPYQDPRFNQAVAEIGFSTDTLTNPEGNQIHFHGESGQFIAWEVSADIMVQAPSFPVGYSLYVQSASDGGGSRGFDDYKTLALRSGSARYSPRFLRNIAKANQAWPTAKLEEAESPTQINTVLEKFEEFPERRDFKPMEDFSAFVHALARVGLLRCFSLRDTISNQRLGTSLVLENGIQANLRFYSADRKLSAGHLLHMLVIERLFDKSGIELVDQSGISSDKVDVLKSGIDEFKWQVGGQKVVFNKVQS